MKKVKTGFIIAFISLGLLLTFSVVHVMFGSSQCTKIHYIVQAHYMPEYLPHWMTKITTDSYPQEIDFWDDGYLYPEYTGTWKTWHKNGNIATIEYYKDGIRTGTEVGWFKNGFKSFEIHYEHGDRNGVNTRWFENGDIWYITNYKNGKKSGKDIIWRKDGNEIHELLYDDGMYVSSRTIRGQNLRTTHY